MLKTLWNKFFNKKPKENNQLYNIDPYIMISHKYKNLYGSIQGSKNSNNKIYTVYSPYLIQICTEKQFNIIMNLRNIDKINDQFNAFLSTSELEDK